MQKVLDLLEQYVEWVALAIGALFMLAMVALYLIGTPISGKIGPNTVTLANVETRIYDDAGRRLEQAMSQPGVPSVQIENYAEKFQKHMEVVNPNPVEPTPTVWVASRGTPTAPLKEDKKEQPTKQEAVAGVPQNLPAPKYYGESSGKSNVETDPAKAGMVVNAPMEGPGMGAPAGMPPWAGGGGMPPGAGGMPPEAIRAMQAAQAQAQAQAQAAMRGGAMQPPAAGGAAAQPVANAGPAGKDKVWVTVAYTISSKDLAAAFEAAKVPTNLMTVFLRLDGVRQEQLPDGSWGNDTKIQPLPIYQVPAYPKTPGEERTYADWATRNAMTLLAPAFYPRLAGDQWYAPGQPNPNKASDIRPVIQPQPMQPMPGRGRGNIPGGPPPGVYPGAPSGIPTGPGGMQGGRRGRQRNYAPDDVQRPSAPFLQAMSPEAAGRMAAQEAADEAERRSRMGGMGGPSGMYPGMPPEMGPGGGFAQPRISVPDGYKVPTGTFNPSTLDSDIFVWFHDDTVEPGKTYRYKMSYRIRNPLNGMDRVAQNPQAAKIFAIESPASDWSEPISVEPLTRFFVASGVAQGATSVRFDVFRWQDGAWHMKQFTTSPGDMIGLLDGKIDYQTGWTLADLNVSSLTNEPVILADQRGKLSTRGFQQDQGVSGKFKKEIDWRDPNAPVRQPPGMAPGMPYGMPPGAYPGGIYDEGPR